MVAGFRTVTWSANEVQALAAKAARGGGAPPAQAVMFGKAVYVHLSQSRSLVDLTDALQALPQGPVLDLPQGIARLLAGAEDGHASGDLVCLQAPELAQSYGATLAFACQITPTPEGAHLGIDMQKQAPRGPVQRVTLDADFLGLITAMAAKTLVPESDASRLAGAGAGLTDND